MSRLKIKKTKSHDLTRYMVATGKRSKKGGNYKRHFFKKRKDAVTFVKATAGSQSRAMEQFFKLEPQLQADLLSLYHLLEAKGMSLETAHDLLSRLEPAEGGSGQVAAAGITIDEAVQKFIDHKRAENRKPGTIREYRSVLERLAENFSGKPLAALQKLALNDWIKTMQWSARTRRNCVTVLRTFFAYWVMEEDIDKNPADRVPKPQVEVARPEILALEQLAPFIDMICREEPRLIAPTVFCLIAGIRVHEGFGLLWSDVDLTGGTVTIPAAIAKGNRERSIKIKKQLRAWLEFCPDRTGRVFKFPTLDNYWEIRKKCYRKAGIERMPRNAFRKCFASFSWSIDQDTKSLCATLGNSPQVAKRFYIAGNVSSSEGKKFKEILPTETKS